MHGARRIPAAQKNEHANEEIQETNKPVVILDGSSLFRRRDDDGSFKLATIAGQFVARLGPEAGMPQATSDLHLRGHRTVVDGCKNVAAALTHGGSGGA